MAVGPFASKYVKQAVVGRFGSDRWSEEQSNMIAEYLYGISALPPCGEYSFNSILLPLAHRVTLQPHSPNSESEVRFAIYARDQLKPQDFILNSLSTTSAPVAAEGSHENESNTASSSSQQKRCSIPILILYGDDDWISFPEVRKYVQEMQSYDVNTTLRIIPHAGHHLYMDNKDEVINSIDNWWTSTGDLQHQRQRPQHLFQQQQR
jgi:pimeloyl-ACP methyl ester carboxylesterase